MRISAYIHGGGFDGLAVRRVACQVAHLGPAPGDEVLAQEQKVGIAAAVGVPAFAELGKRLDQFGRAG